MTPQEDYSSNYPDMSSKSLVGKVKAAKKFVKSKDLPSGGGVGKGITPVSSGGKKKGKRRKK